MKLQELYEAKDVTRALEFFHGKFLGSAQKEMAKYAKANGLTFKIEDGKQKPISAGDDAKEMSYRHDFTGPKAAVDAAIKKFK